MNIDKLLKISTIIGTAMSIAAAVLYAIKSVKAKETQKTQGGQSPTQGGVGQSPTQGGTTQPSYTVKIEKNQNFDIFNDSYPEFGKMTFTNMTLVKVYENNKLVMVYPYNTIPVFGKIGYFKYGSNTYTGSTDGLYIVFITNSGKKYAAPIKDFKYHITLPAEEIKQVYIGEKIGNTIIKAEYFSYTLQGFSDILTHLNNSLTAFNMQQDPSSIDYSNPPNIIYSLANLLKSGEYVDFSTVSIHLFYPDAIVVPNATTLNLNIYERTVYSAAVQFDIVDTNLKGMSAEVYTVRQLAQKYIDKFDKFGDKKMAAIGFRLLNMFHTEMYSVGLNAWVLPLLLLYFQPTKTVFAEFINEYNVRGNTSGVIIIGAGGSFGGFTKKIDCDTYINYLLMKYVHNYDTSSIMYGGYEDEFSNMSKDDILELFKLYKNVLTLHIIIPNKCWNNEPVANGNITYISNQTEFDLGKLSKLSWYFKFLKNVGMPVAKGNIPFSYTYGEGSFFTGWCTTGAAHPKDGNSYLSVSLLFDEANGIIKQHSDGTLFYDGGFCEHICNYPPKTTNSETDFPYTIKLDLNAITNKLNILYQIMINSKKSCFGVNKH